jgi:hypothetical protein
LNEQFETDYSDYAFSSYNITSFLNPKFDPEKKLQLSISFKESENSNLIHSKIMNFTIFSSFNSNYQVLFIIFKK